MTNALSSHLILCDPLTTVSLAHWIEDCETEFEKFELSNPNINERSKISFGGSALLSSQPAIEGLRQWWRANSADLKRGTWSEFVEKLKLEAFGRHHRLDALEAVYRLQQNGNSVDEYVTKFRSARESLDVVDAHAIDEQQYKQFLLFRADAPLCARVRALPGFDLQTISFPRLEGLLREYGPIMEENKYALLLASDTGLTLFLVLLSRYQRSGANRKRGVILTGDRSSVIST